MTTANIPLDSLSQADAHPRPKRVASSRLTRAVAAVALGALGMGMLLVVAAQFVPQVLVVTF